jgi:hypothetical protein
VDTQAVSQLIDDLHSWGGALYYTHGWRLPYWEEEDWRQYAVEWGLRILQKYGSELTSGHAFTLVRTSLYRDLIDSTRSVVADPEIAVENCEPSQQDVAWLYCIPTQAEEFLRRLIDLPLEAWERAETTWRGMGKKKLLTSIAGLSFLTGLPENQVQASIVLLESHFSTT